MATTRREEAPAGGARCAVRPRLHDPAELDGLVTRLRENVRPVQREDFARGALLPDGRLDLCKQTLGPEGVAVVAHALRGNTAVNALLLGANQAGPAGGRAVAQLLRGPSSLEAVYLGCNQLGPEATADLAAAVSGHATVRQLWLKRNAVGDPGAHALAAALAQSPGLRTLDLVSDDLTAAGVDALAAALARPGAGLAHLFLDGNALGLAGAEAVARMLRASPSLHTLSLGCNALGDAGAAVLAEALAHNTTLRSLDLSSNDLGPAAAEALAVALRGHPSLVELSLGYAAATEALGVKPNRLGDPGAFALADALAHNTTLEALDLSRADLGPEGVLRLLDAAEDHPALRVLRVGRRLPDPVRYRVMALACRPASHDPATAARTRDLAQVKSVFRTALGAPAGPAAPAQGLLEHVDPVWFDRCLDAPEAPAHTEPRDAVGLGLPPADLATAERVLRALADKAQALRHEPSTTPLGRVVTALHGAARALRRAPQDTAMVVPPRAPGALRAGRGALAETGQRRAREAQGIALAALSNAALRDADTATAAPSSGRLARPQRCYVCKTPYAAVHSFYAALCPACAALNLARRTQSADLAGRWFVLTGARIKIGFEIALKLLRAGATVVATTRFPHDAARRFAAVSDHAAWAGRLRLVGLDLADIPRVERFARDLAATLPRLDGVINNAAQTVWRPPDFYAALHAREALAPEALAPAERALLADELCAAPGSFAAAGEGLARSSALFPEGSDDGFGQPLDLRATNSWRLRLGEVSTREALSCYAVNALAPFVLLNALRPRMAADPDADKWVVNVSAVEGQFARWHKTPRHPHTNMAKAALNMLTRTAADDWARDRIFMTAVDTGWVSNENPWDVAEGMARKGFQTPLDETDGAARVLDPVFQGARSGQNVWGVFLKDYKAAPW